MRLVFVMDAVSTINPEGDTSFALMLEAQNQGHRVDHCLVQDVYMEGTRVCARVRKATCRREPLPPVVLADAEDVDLAETDAVFVRKDPPFDANYLWLTLLLEHLRDRTLVVNDPRGLRDANEKLYAYQFPEFVPETLVSADKERIKAFMHHVGGQAVIKDIDGHGGENIFALREGDDNINALIEVSTHFGRRMALVQRYLPEVRQGDKRLILLDGEFLGAINRVPQGGELRSNMHVGGRVEATEITANDRRIMDGMADKLRRDGLWFVGIDIIGECLTEVNVTSPTGIQEMSRLTGENVSAKVIDWVQSRV